MVDEEKTRWLQSDWEEPEGGSKETTLCEWCPVIQRELWMAKTLHEKAQAVIP